MQISKKSFHMSPYLHCHPEPSMFTIPVTMGWFTNLSVYGQMIKSDKSLQLRESPLVTWAMTADCVYSLKLLYLPSKTYKLLYLQGGHQKLIIQANVFQFVRGVSKEQMHS